MRTPHIIIKKRDGGTLSTEEIDFLISGYLSGAVEEYQISAFLMAVFFRGMTPEETAALTTIMMNSGETYEWNFPGRGRAVDKHSTGGVGDKVSLPLAPLAAVCGAVVPMISGRGLGHTGGTLDKLESIPGFRVATERAQFEEQLGRLGVVMGGQSSKLVPADKRLYALRDVTGTVESIPLICASILSKKAASGAKALVMDVKCGSGAFMQTEDEAFQLAAMLQRVGRGLGLPVHAFVTDMNQPIGRAVGNSLEVMESVECLQGGGPPDLRHITVELTAEMLALADIGLQGGSDARAAAERALDDGTAYKRFVELIEAQHGDAAALERKGGLDVAPGREAFKAHAAGWVSAMNCREIGNAAMVLGAGRAKTTDSIDPGVGLLMNARVGDKVERGQPLIEIVHRNEHGLHDCLKRLAAAITISEEPAQPLNIIKERLA